MSNNRQFHVLVVDDDSLIQQSMKLCMPTQWRMVSATQISEVPFDRFFHAAFVDMHLQANSKEPHGLEIIKKLSAKNPQLEIIAMSGDLSRELMEACLKAGAQRFLAKPLMGEEIQLILEKIEALWDLRQLSQDHRQTGYRWIGTGPTSQKMQKRIAELKGETSPVLIEGETGTGKEVVARLLHQQESNRPFVVVNIASIPENLFESELFGHMKGAFTGADQNKIGLCEAAHGGDLFLDEIEAMPLSQQVKLLRFLESGEIRRVGAKDTIKVQCRVIAASNQSLEKLVKEEKFREDLLFRLRSQRVQLPPLRERLEDLAALTQYFLTNEYPRRNKSFSTDGLEAMSQYAWPGNVRELKRVCEQLSLTSPLPILRKEDVLKLIHPPITSQNSFANLHFEKGLTTLTEEFETYVIKECLKKEKDIEKSAEKLKVSRSNLYKKIKDYNIDTDEVLS